MADTYTTNLNLTKPEPGAAEDTWGISLNDDLDTLDAIFSSSGTQINLNPNQINFADNKKAVFNSNLNIFSTGTSSYIEEVGTGDLYLKASNLYITDRENNQFMSMIDNGTGGTLSLKHLGSTVLTTTSSGINVTGTVTADGLVVDGNATLNPTSNFVTIKGATNDNDYSGIIIQSNWANTSNEKNAGQIQFQADDNDITGSTYTTFATINAETTDWTGDSNIGGHITIQTSEANSLKNRLRVSNNGDISFYDDTGSTQGLFWDASTERLGIGNTAPKSLLNVTGTGADGGILTLENDADSLVTDRKVGQIHFYSNDGSANGTGVKADIKAIAENSIGSEIGLAFGTSDTSSATAVEAMRISAGGNVGIGTDNPVVTLNVDSDAQNEIARFQGANAQLRIDNNTLNVINLNSGGSGDALSLSTGGSEAIRIEDNQNVGIGTTAPDYALDVRDDANIQLKLASTTATNNARMVFAPNNVIKWNVGVNYNDNELSFYDQTTATTPVRFEQGAANNTLVVDSNSRVGIGTNAPTSTLTVNGTINGVGIKANETDFTGSILISDDGATGTLSSATSNTGLGSLVLANLTSGDSNVAVGRQALNSLTTGSNNTAVGRNALLNSTANNNTAVGYSALSDNTTGQFNTAIGRDALENNTTASNNTAIGYTSLQSNTTGSNNTAVGYENMKRNTTGIRNTAIGQQALAFNTTGNDNTALGLQALFKNTTGSSNVSVGYDSLEQNTTGSNNVAVGHQALDSNTEGSSNIAIGRDAMQLNTTGQQNVAMGYEALHTNSTGHSNTAIGHQTSFNITTGIRNTALGYQSLRNQTTASGTVAVGHNALFNNTTGSSNVAVGYTAMSANTTGGSNTAVGYEALRNNLAESHNTAIGYRALKDGTTGASNIAVGGYALANSNGNDNVAVGYSALITNTTGQNNVAIGNYALRNNTTVSSNIAVGYLTLENNTTGFGNTAVGTNSLRFNTTSTGNSAFGYQALYNNTGQSNVGIGYTALFANTSGSDNTAVGRSALVSNTTGAFNTAVGKQALDSNTSASNNTALGYQAATNLTTGANSVAIGYQTLLTATTSNNNVAIGYQALKDSTGANNVAIGTSAATNLETSNGNTAIGTSALQAATGGVNTAIGFGSLKNNTTGTNNTALGYDALRDNTTGDASTAVGRNALENATATDNTAIGKDAGISITTGSNNTCIGKSSDTATATSTNSITLGDANITSLRCNTQTISALSDARDKANVEDLQLGVEFIKDLRPVSFTWDRRDGSQNGVEDFGFIAQELDAVQEKHNEAERLGLVLKDNPDKLEASYGKLVPMLVKAIQEQQEQIEELKQKLGE